MEVRDFAERILFGTRLEDKLLEVSGPKDLTDLRRGAGIAAVELPGRPEPLSLVGTRPRVPFPDLRQLEEPRSRGHVLHFFANHELLAMELMALGLLRFPDAPSSFRNGLVGTILDEQRHLRLYLSRMKAFGVELGEIPVNRYFWDTISSMAAPMDLVVRMSMTFEQANLDYSAYYARAFETVGDLDTAEALKQVFEDEIKHVSHGVVWFEKWRAQGLDPFEAYCSHLPHPLTASRARGRSFEVEARRKAGLPEAFIRRLELYGSSRGRPPVVHFFNPLCESEVAYGLGFTPRADARHLAADLEVLPIFLAGADDLVAVSRLPSHGFLRGLHEAGMEIPEVQVCPSAEPIDVDHDKIMDVRPWGWSPAAAARAALLKGRLVESAPSLDWNPARRAIFSKEWSAGLLAELSDAWSWPDWWTGPEAVAVVASSVQEVLSQCRRLLGLGHARAVAKAPWGTSGRGALRIDEALLAPGQEGWIKRSIRRQGGLLVEPWLDRWVDLSLQLNVGVDGQVKVLGLTRFATDERGQYLGTYLADATWNLPPQLRRWLGADGLDKRRLPRFVAALAEFVGGRLMASGHRGLAGVDMMVCRGAGGAPSLKPIVEINPRTTMGHVALRLRKRCAKGVNGFWRLLSLKDLERLGHDGPEAFALWLLEHHPLETVETDRGRRWLSGALLTNDPKTASRVVSLVMLDSAEVSLSLDGLAVDSGQ